MKVMQLQPITNSLSGILHVPGDKSISHRAIMLGSLAIGKTTVNNFLTGEDCLRTISCFRELGVEISIDDDTVVINGVGLEGLKEPADVLDVGNSGTTIRLLLGVLASRPFHAVVTGDASISRRPMDRVTKPLSEMNAVIDGRQQAKFTPLSIRGGETKGLTYQSPVASAQVKSALLLAGLGSTGTTSVSEPSKSRDHTERMLKAFGANVIVNGNQVSVSSNNRLTGRAIEVPGDISSAAFFLAAAAITPGSEIILKNVGINPTRTGIIDVLKQMGANLSIENERVVNEEPVADLTMQYSQLTGIEIGGDLIPRLIDEIPIIALLATQATGQTRIKDAAELKVKETNRIETVATELTKLGATIKPTADGLVITGKTPLRGAIVDSFGDHRIGMMNAIATCIADGEITLLNSDAVSVSYPNFFEDLAYLSGNSPN